MYLNDGIVTPLNSASSADRYNASHGIGAVNGAGSTLNASASFLGVFAGLLASAGNCQNPIAVAARMTAHRFRTRPPMGMPHPMFGSCA